MSNKKNNDAWVPCFLLSTIVIISVLSVIYRTEEEDVQYARDCGGVIDEVLTDDGSDSEGETKEGNIEICAHQNGASSATGAACGDGKEVEEKYVNAMSMASKLHKGELFQQAAEKFTEAIDLYPIVTKKGGSLMSLHYNRSACYEKAGIHFYDFALHDVNIVLKSDAKHLKARARRARIYEAQGKLQEALIEYTIHFSTEQEMMQSTGGGNPTEGMKIQELGKLVAMNNVAVALEKMRQGSHEQSPLPNKTFCNMIFEMLPSTHRWKDQFDSTVAIDTLIQRFDNAPPENNLYELMNVVICALSMESFQIALKYIGKSASVALSVESNANHLLSLRARLQGVFKQLQRNLTGAMVCYNESISYDPHNTESLLMLASSSIEYGEVESAQQLFSRILTHLVGDHNKILHQFVLSSSEGILIDNISSFVENIGAKYIRENFDEKTCIELAYCFLHRAHLWVVRDSKHEFRPNAVVLAEQDLLLALTILEGIGNSNKSCRVARMAYIQTLLKLIHLMGQTKGLTGVPQTEDDIVKCKNYMDLAIIVEPDHPQVIMLRGDVLAMEDRFDEAMIQIERLIYIANKDDGIPYVMKANMLTHQGMKYLTEFQEKQDPTLYQKALDFFKEAGELYDNALKVESQCVEALAQACQLKCLLGEYESAAAYAEKAVPLARTADELNDLESLRVQTTTHLAVFQEMLSSKK